MPSHPNHSLGLPTESDVEQKIVLPLLTGPEPSELGIPPQYLLTKPNIRSFRIDKGANAKSHFPDYLVQFAGVPLVVVEVKKPSEDLAEAYREARLYANELNALFPTRINPVRRVLATNGEDICFGWVDQAEPTHQGKNADAGVSTKLGAALRELIGWKTLRKEADRVVAHFHTLPRFKPAKLLGGTISRNQEIAKNPFGETLTISHQGLFDPKDWTDRVRIVREAYVPSKSRLRYVDPIDKIIRVAKSRIDLDAREIQDSSRPLEVIKAIGNPKALESQIILLVGQRGAGKTTFVDYLQVVALSEEVVSNVVWCRVNLNNAPLERQRLYDWIAEQVTQACRVAMPGRDFDELDTLQAVFSVEINRFEKGPGQLIRNQADEYNRRLTDLITRLQSSRTEEARAHSRYVCGQRGKTLVIAFDNCDKKERSDQLLMFEAARWAQSEFKSVVFLPMREETYENHASEPPLDTVQKNFVFRIEPPLFQKVLINRIQLAMRDIAKQDAKMLQYDLPQGYHVSYPAEDQAYYLTSLVASVFEHDKILRRMISGLAGADVRKALEMFVAICKSGHIGADELLKIRKAAGKYSLPSNLIARVLLRLNRRFYDGQKTYLPNVFSTESNDLVPQPLSRLALLRWLHARFNRRGPSGVVGYFQVGDIKAGLSPYFDPSIVDRELRALVDARTIVAERAFSSDLGDSDLVRLAPAGFVMLDALSSIEYLAAVAEETWFPSKATAENIADIIRSEHTQFLPKNALKLARTLVDHLRVHQRQLLLSSADEPAIADSEIRELVDLGAAELAIARAASAGSAEESPWIGLSKRVKVGDELVGRVQNRSQRYGVFVKIEAGVTGLINRRTLPEDSFQSTNFLEGEFVKVRVQKIDAPRRRMRLDYLAPFGSEADAPAFTV